MATRKTLTIGKPSDAEAGGESHAVEVDEKRPRNLPPVALSDSGFSLVVDGKAKSQYDSAAAASEAGKKLKRAFPVLQVIVYDAVEKTRTAIEP